MEQELLKLILVEIREMKGDISELKDSVKSIDTRLTNVENDITEVKKDVSEMKVDMAEMKENISENTKDIKGLKEMSEFYTENIDAIKNVVTNHYREFKKHVKTNEKEHRLYNTKLLKFDKEN